MLSYDSLMIFLVMLFCRINGNLCDKSMAIWHSMFVHGLEVSSGKVICYHMAKCAVELLSWVDFMRGLVLAEKFQTDEPKPLQLCTTYSCLLKSLSKPQ